MRETSEAKSWDCGAWMCLDAKSAVQAVRKERIQGQMVTHCFLVYSYTT